MWLMTGGLRKPLPACQIHKTSGRAHLRHRNICADTCAVGIKHHAVVRMKAGPQRLIRAEMHIARQQHLKAIVAVALTKEIRIIAEPFDDLAVEVDIQRRIAVDLQLFRSDTQGDLISWLQLADGRGKLQPVFAVVDQGNKPARATLLHARGQEVHLR